MDAGRPDRTSRDVWSDLVDGVLDARTEEATRRFDAELEASVSEGQVSEQAAENLRAWQRAAMRELTHHVRTVLPATLRAVDTARQDALASAEEMARHLVGTPEPSTPASVPSGPGVNAAMRATEARQPTTGAARPTGAPADDRRASPAPPAQPRTLEERRPRLLVADLTETRKDRTN